METQTVRSKVVVVYRSELVCQSEFNPCPLCFPACAVCVLPLFGFDFPFLGLNSYHMLESTSQKNCSCQAVNISIEVSVFRGDEWVDGCTGMMFPDGQ